MITLKHEFTYWAAGSSFHLIEVVKNLVEVFPRPNKLWEKLSRHFAFILILLGICVLKDWNHVCVLEIGCYRRNRLTSELQWENCVDVEPCIEVSVVPTDWNLIPICPEPKMTFSREIGSVDNGWYE